jgi:hypothetical protein
MRSSKGISDRQIIQIALILWGVITIGSLITNGGNLALSSAIAVALGLYGLRIMRKREQTGEESKERKSN